MVINCIINSLINKLQPLFLFVFTLAKVLTKCPRYDDGDSNENTNNRALHLYRRIKLCEGS